MLYKTTIMKTAIIHARVEPSIKAGAESVLRRLGLTPTEAIRIFYNQILLKNGLPFKVEIPNKLTEETLEKSSRDIDIEKFDSVEKMFQNRE